MTTKNYERHNCPIAKTLAAVGDQWTLMIVRDAFRGRRRFEEFQASLEISRNLLTSRLKRMVEDGLLERYLIDGSKRHGYRPTEKCLALRPTLLAMAEWGEDWYADPAGRRLLIQERESGAEVGLRFCRLDTKQTLEAEQVTTKFGPAVR